MDTEKTHAFLLIKDPGEGVILRVQRADSRAETVVHPQIRGIGAANCRPRPRPWLCPKDQWGFHTHPSPMDTGI